MKIDLLCQTAIFQKKGYQNNFLTALALLSVSDLIEKLKLKDNCQTPQCIMRIRASLLSGL